MCTSRERGGLSNPWGSHHGLRTCHTKKPAHRGFLCMARPKGVTRRRAARPFGVSVAALRCSAPLAAACRTPGVLTMAFGLATQKNPLIAGFSVWRARRELLAAVRLAPSGSASLRSAALRRLQRLVEPLGFSPWPSDLPHKKTRSSRVSLYGAPEGIRTPGLRLRRAALYPAELRAHLTDCRVEAGLFRSGPAGCRTALE